MLSLRSQQKIVSKIITAKNGERVLATFLVSEIGGELQVRLLSASPVVKSKRIRNLPTGQAGYELGIREDALRLSGSCLRSPSITFYRHNYHDIPSPFFNTLEFFISQPTRAPSIN